MFSQTRKIIALILAVSFISSSIQAPAIAQIDPLPFMPQPGTMVHLSPQFSPAYLKGIVVHPEDPFKFDFIIYKGEQTLSDAQKREEYTKLTKYFLASLAIPDDDQWVNLSPYEKDHIIKDDFGKTEMGRDLLAQDYMLKQITASLIYPKNNLGKEFWSKVYAQAQKQYGTSDVPVNTFNKVWIVPDSALIYEKDNMAYVVNHHLKVMLEEDYLSLQKHTGVQEVPANKIHTIASKIVREIVLPELQKEVNEDKNFAPLRQVYSGMILAAWFKRALKQSVLGQIYANKTKVRGVDQDPRTNEVIYQQYLRAYKKGVFNFIKEDVDVLNGQPIPRKYFSGGTEGDAAMFNADRVKYTDKAEVAASDIKKDGGSDKFDFASTVVANPAASKTAEKPIPGDFENRVPYLTVPVPHHDYLPDFVRWDGKAIKRVDAAMTAGSNDWLAPDFQVPEGLFKGLPDAEKYFKGRPLAGVRILFRVNLNVSIEDGQVSKDDTARLMEAVPLLNLLLAQGADVILIGHNGRAKPKDNRKSVEATEKFFQAQFPDTSVKFYPKYFDEDGYPLLKPSVLVKDPTKKSPGSISIGENIRLSDEEEPVGSEKRKAFGQLLTSLADAYVVDAFADIDSKGVSMEDLPGLFVQAGKKVFVGPSMVIESERLIAAQQKGVKVIISGAEKEEKLGPVQDILKNGKLAQGGFILLGSSPSLRLQKETDHPLMHKDNKDKVFTALDYVGTGDIDPQTIDLYSQKLDTVNSGDTVLVQGILGWAENKDHPEYENGTRAIWHKLGELADRGVQILFAGGSGVLYAVKYHLDRKLNVVLVTAGGVTNKILAGRSLVGVEAMKKATATAAMTVDRPLIAIFPGQVYKLNEDIGPFIDRQLIFEGIAAGDRYGLFSMRYQHGNTIAVVLLDENDKILAEVASSNEKEIHLAICAKLQMIMRPFQQKLIPSISGQVYEDRDRFYLERLLSSTMFPQYKRRGRAPSTAAPVIGFIPQQARPGLIIQEKVDGLEQLLALDMHYEGEGYYRIIPFFKKGRGINDPLLEAKEYWRRKMRVGIKWLSLINSPLVKGISTFGVRRGHDDPELKFEIKSWLRGQRSKLSWDQSSPALPDQITLAHEASAMEETKIEEPVKQVVKNPFNYKKFLGQYGKRVGPNTLVIIHRADGKDISNVRITYISTNMLNYMDPANESQGLIRLSSKDVNTIEFDEAMSSPGGIDLNSANLAMMIKRDGKGVVLPLASQDLAQLSRAVGDGLEPHILSIVPASRSTVFSQLVAQP